MADMDQGIIQREASEAPQTPTGRQTGGGSLRKQMQVPPDQLDTFERIVAAGRKLLYSEQLAPEIAALLDGEGDTGTKLGTGVVALLAMLLTKAQGAIPAQLVIPAGVALVEEAADMLEEAGEEISDADVAEGVAVMVQEIMQRAGVDVEQLPELLKQAGGGQPPAPAEPAQPAPPAPQEA